MDELVYQIRTAKATALFLHPDSLKVGLEAARITGIREERIILFSRTPGDSHLTIDDFVADGLAHPRHWVEPRLKKGESKTKLALLLFCRGMFTDW